MKELIHQISKLKLEIKSIESQKSRGRKIESLKFEIRKIERQLYLVTLDVLIEENTIVLKAVEENKMLLFDSDIIFNVSKSGTGLITSYTKELSGKIAKNGYAYCEAKSVSNSIVDSFSTIGGFLGMKVYPKEFTGSINYLGETTLEVTNHGYALVGSYIPKQFTGTINENGVIKIVLTKKSWELMGNYFFTRLVADPFKGNEVNRNLFYKNIQTINFLALERIKRMS